MVVNIGISQHDLRRISKILSEVLADTLILAIKTRGFHWNVTGKLFIPLHQLFEEQYKEMEESADLLAERIRALGQKAPGSFAEFKRLAEIQETEEDWSENHMLRQLAHDHALIINRIRNHIKALEETKDYETADMLTERLQVHGKFAWMLRSHLG